MSQEAGASSRHPAGFHRFNMKLANSLLYSYMAGRLKTDNGKLTMESCLNCYSFFISVHIRCIGKIKFKQALHLLHNLL